MRSRRLLAPAPPVSPCGCASTSGCASPISAPRALALSTSARCPSGPRTSWTSPGLGGIRLQGEVLWSRRAGRKRVLRGKRLVYYQSGLIFRWLTPAQRAGLVAALDILKGAQED